MTIEEFEALDGGVTEWVDLPYQGDGYYKLHRSRHSNRQDFDVWYANPWQYQLAKGVARFTHTEYQLRRDGSEIVSTIDAVIKMDGLWGRGFVWAWTREGLIRKETERLRSEIEEREAKILVLAALEGKE